MRRGVSGPLARGGAHGANSHSGPIAWAADTSGLLDWGSGRAGLGNYNRNLYTANTSIAFGLKGVFWFIGQEMMDRKTWEFNTCGKDITKKRLNALPWATMCKDCRSGLSGG